MKDDVGQSTNGFGNDDGFDSFLAMGPPPPPQVNIFHTSFLFTSYQILSAYKTFSQRTYVNRNDSHDSDEPNTEIHVVIRPKDSDMSLGLATPILAPPPRGSQNNSIYSGGIYFITYDFITFLTRVFCIFYRFLAKIQSVRQGR